MVAAVVEPDIKTVTGKCDSNCRPDPFARAGNKGYLRAIRRMTLFDPLHLSAIVES